MMSEQTQLRETAMAYAAAGGDILHTAEVLCCHQNTVRYRLGKLRELTEMQELTDMEFYLHIRLACVIECARVSLGHS